MVYSRQTIIFGTRSPGIMARTRKMTHFDPLLTAQNHWFLTPIFQGFPFTFWVHCIAHQIKNTNISIGRNAIAFSSLMTGHPKNVGFSENFWKFWPNPSGKPNTKSHFFDFSRYPPGKTLKSTILGCFWAFLPIPEKWSFLPSPARKKRRF